MIGLGEASVNGPASPGWEGVERERDWGVSRWTAHSASWFLGRPGMLQFKTPAGSGDDLV